jgi:hypothetical protein
LTTGGGGGGRMTGGGGGGRITGGGGGEDLHIALQLVISLFLQAVAAWVGPDPHFITASFTQSQFPPVLDPPVLDPPMLLIQASIVLIKTKMHINNIIAFDI